MGQTRTANLLAQAKNSQECFVDSPLLFRGDPACQISEATGVNGADLLDEDSRDLAEYVYLGAE
jgi:hypothetical protein